MFLQILSMSYTASYVILFVIIGRMFLKKTPKIFSYILWSVVLFRLLCPFTFSSVWSLIPEKTTALPIEVNYSDRKQMMTMNTGTTTFGDANNSKLPARITDSSKISSQQEWIIKGEMLWLAGISIFVIFSIISQLRLHWKLVGAVRLRDNIYLVDHLESPFVMGLICPKIYLPSTLSDQEQNYIILHEQTHIRRFDHIVKILSFTGLVIHWFNPLVWVAYFLSENDMEMSCDESVMKHMDRDIRSDYSALLLGLATGRRTISGVPLAFGEGDIKGRIKNVMNYKKPAFWGVIVTLLAVIIAVTGLIANPHTGRESMRWAKDLTINDVKEIELVRIPGAPDEGNWLLDESDFGHVVTLINESRGKYVKNPESLDGASIIYNITLTNGITHYVCNYGNTYLIIDGDYYEAGYDWLSTWDNVTKEAVSSSEPVFILPVNNYATDTIQFEYPGEWIIKDNPTEDMYFEMFYSSDSEDKPVFWYSMGEAWLTDFDRTREDYKALLSESYTDLKITDLKQTKIGGYDATRLIFTYSLDGKEYVMTQYETIVGYASYQFYYTYPADESAESESTRDIVISSIKFKGQDTPDSMEADNKDSSGMDNSRIEDYADEKTLQFLSTPNGELLKQTADGFVKAYFSADNDMAWQYFADDADYKGNMVYQVDGEAVNVYDKLNHLLVKQYTVSDEKAELYYEYRFEGEDSYTYMNVELKCVDGKWLITNLLFEK